MGKSQSNTDFVFEKNSFYAGEDARVRIICDNSKCSKAVKSFKFKIYREIAGRTGNKKHSIDNEGYIFSVKEKGCKAKSKSDRIICIKLPSEDPEFKAPFHTSIDETDFRTSFTPSTLSSVFQVSYTIRAFVKHDSWNEFGEGKHINHPIRIVQPPL
jgi:hypothetical protein